MRRRWAAAAAALTLAGCGGSNTPAAPTPTATATAKLAATDCAGLTQVAREVATALTGATGSQSDKAKQLLDQLAVSAPEAIRPDLAKIAAAYQQIVSAMQSAGANPGSTPSPEQLQKLTQVLASVDQGELTRANANITAWVQSHC
jgi:hypothetical protein